MAAPTNQTPATATVIAALPASIVQDVHDAGTTYTVWYKYTAVQELVIGVFGYGGGGAYTPATEVYSDEGVTKIVPHPHPLVLPDDDKAVQFQVDKASTYWIRFITNPGDPSPALLQIEAETAPTESIATGAIAVPDDSDNRPCALLSQTVDYKVLNFAQPFPNGEAGDILDSGYILTEDGITFEAIGFHPDMTRDKTVISAGTGPLKIRTCRGPQRFYVAEYKGSPPISVSVVDASGVVVGTHSLTGVDFPTVTHDAYRADYGSRWSEGIVDVQPPALGPRFPVMVAQVDRFGNERGGVPTVEILAPLATYAPWNLRVGYPGGTDELTDFVGTYVPLAKTEAERRVTGDPRPSIETLYRDKDDFLRAAREAAEALAERGLLLHEHVDAVVERAGAHWDWIMSRE